MSPEFRCGQLVERIDYSLLFRWFVGLGMDDAMWNNPAGTRMAKSREGKCSEDLVGCESFRGSIHYDDIRNQEQSVAVSPAFNSHSLCLERTASSRASRSGSSRQASADRQ
jgi:hypothetical protein